MWIERDIEPVVAGLARQRAALLLTGCRQAGKTSLCRHAFPSHHYISLDLPMVAEEAEEAGEQFLAKHPTPVIIDEVQYAPQLFRYLKAAIDHRREETGLYCLTGSQKFALMQRVSESLAGRVAVLHCHSLSLRELERWSGRKAERAQLLEWIWLGGYPELHAKGLDPQQFYADYMATYLERDVRQVLHVKNLRDFERFLRLAAVRIGQLLSLNSFAADIGVSPNTIKSWLSVLEASGVLCLVEPYYRNLGKRLVKTPKLYFLDTGLACFLAGVRSVHDLQHSAMLGAFFENHVLAQMVRHFANRGETVPIYFYRDQYGHEIDFVIGVGKKLKLYECKWSETPDVDVPGFQEMERRIGRENILVQAIITPNRSVVPSRKSPTIFDNSVDLQSLK